jgi:hypothetical protein
MLTSADSGRIDPSGIRHGTCDIWFAFTIGHYILGDDTPLAENG